MSQRYGLALMLLVLAVVFTMAVGEGAWERVVAMAIQGLALYATLLAAEAHRRFRVLFSLIFVVALAGAIVQAGLTGGSGTGSGYVRASVFLIVVATLPIVGSGVVRQVRSAQQITVQTMMGVLCAYLLLMSAFAYAYAVLGELGTGPFFNQGEQWNEIGDYVYYSLITITTVGMGDLTPATQFGRSLTAAEALIGQIYMVTVVAVIVSNLGRKSVKAPATSASTGEAGEAGGGSAAPRDTEGER
jgi:hypothetical protein